MNETFFYFFYGLAHQFDFLDKVVIFLAVYLPYVVVVLAFLFLVFHHNIHSHTTPFKEFRNKWKEFFFVFFTGAFAWVMAAILKILVHTPRPFMILTNVQPLFAESGFAFPSGHATFFSAIAFALFIKHKRVGYVFILFAILIGIARVTAGVHFPIDILGGFLIGYLITRFLRFL